MRLIKNRSIFLPLAALLLIALGIIGNTTPNELLEPFKLHFLILGVLLLLYALLRTTYCESNKDWLLKSEPQRIEIKSLDYLKALICWIDSYRRTYAIIPGLYYTGSKYDNETPLLVTANYHLTVFSILWHLGNKNVRLLVIDSDGINVWCAAGKGRFSNAEIYKQLFRFGDFIKPDEKGKIQLVLPKLAFSGVNLSNLRKANIDPIVGPVNAKSLWSFLDNKPLVNQISDRVIFDLPSRFFSMVPGFFQTIYQALLVFFGLWVLEILFNIPTSFAVILIPAIIAFLYPLFYPYLPSSWFALKGLILGIAIGLISMWILISSESGMLMALALFLYTVATGIYFGLAFTGNSPVSNYSRVRREIITFLPVTVIMYATCLVIYIVGVK